MITAFFLDIKKLNKRMQRAYKTVAIKHGFHSYQAITAILINKRK